MKTLIFLVTSFAFLSHGKGWLTSIGSYAEDFSDLEFPDEREDCAEGACSLYAEKRMIVPEKVVEHRQLVPRLQPINAPESFAQRRTSICGCIGQNEVIDLGEGHHPKYMTITVCKSTKIFAKSNKFYQCQDYKYMLNVLVKRGVSSILKNVGEVVEELGLPASLNASWQLFAISVPVACIAVERS